MKDACHLVAAWTASRKKWFDFCYRFAVCVKLCYQSRPVLSPHPHGAVTDILATVRPPTQPFPTRAVLCVLIDFVSPFGRALCPVFMPVLL
jgi:hypothetical protein